MEPDEEREDTRALEAAQRNDASEIRRLRSSGVEVNMGFEAGPYPMEAALDLGHLDAFWALAEGADSDVLEFALCLAADVGAVEVFDRLRAMGVPAMAEDGVGTRVLTYAVRGKGERPARLAIVQRLLAENVDTTEAVTAAAHLRDTGTLTLLRGGAPSFGLTDAVALGDLAAVRFALEKEAPDAKHIEQAAGKGEVELLRLLLSHTAERPPLAMNSAIANNHPAAVRVLLENGWKANGGQRVIHAARLGHVEVLNVFLEMGGDPNETRDYGVTAVWEAVASNHVDALDVLLRAGADPSRVSFCGSPLHMALARGRSSAVVDRLQTVGARDVPPPPRG